MKTKNTKIELNRFISTHSHYSRRKATDLIKLDKVFVNQTLINQPYFKIDVNQDKVKLNGKIIKPGLNKPLYYLLNKPVGYVSSTRTDASQSPPVTSLIQENSKIYPVGRLDINSEGLIILTNDGKLTYKLTHPSSHIEKEYRVEIKGKINPNKINLLEKGVVLKEGITQPCKIKIIQQSKNHTTLSIILTEGRNRQIRRMLPAVNLHVVKLTRIRIGNLKLGNLSSGKYRQLTKDEINSLVK